jgi:hypothetical protein
MFDFWRRNKYNRPERYKDLIDEKGFNETMIISLKCLKRLNIEVLKIEDGDISYKNNENEIAHYYLDNLIRKLASLDESERFEEINRHFESLQDKSDAHNYLYKDYEYANQFLKVLIKPKDTIPSLDDFIHKSDYPETSTFLVFDFEGQFVYIRKDRAKAWEKTDEELFSVALHNISKEEVEIKEYSFGDKFLVYILFNGDFSASYTLELEKNVELSIGTFGSLIAIPTKGTALIHPIETNDILDLVSILYPLIENFYNEDPGNISLDFYWYKDNQFEIFPKQPAENNLMTIHLPEKLKSILEDK